MAIFHSALVGDIRVEFGGEYIGTKHPAAGGLTTTNSCLCIAGLVFQIRVGHAQGEGDVARLKSTLHETCSIGLRG